MKIRPIDGWGVASKNGHGKFGLVYPVMGTRKEIYEKFPWVKGNAGFKVVRVRIRALTVAGDA